MKNESESIHGQVADVASKPRSVILEREMSHPPEKVWRALTQGALIEAWLMKNDFQPIVGHKFTLRAEPKPNWNGVIDCEVLSVEPQTRLSYGWKSLGVATVVTWTLTPTASGVHVRMEQSGFRPDQTFNYKGATYGWQLFMAGLEKTVAALS
jgi:uncharacterized protein YndB with AHSA1/START domain